MNIKVTTATTIDVRKLMNIGINISKNFTNNFYTKKYNLNINGNGGVPLL